MDKAWLWVTLGNMIGGMLVGITYWFIYLRDPLLSPQTSMRRQLPRYPWPTVLTAKALTQTYPSGEVKGAALQDIDLESWAGNRLSPGPSGSGKIEGNFVVSSAG